MRRFSRQPPKSHKYPQRPFITTRVPPPSPFPLPPDTCPSYRPQHTKCLPNVSIRPRHTTSLPHHCTAIREYDAKLLLAYWLERAPPVDPSATVATKFVYPAPRVAQVSWDPATNSITPDTQLPGWVFNTKLVAKPDQLIKRRGKAGLLSLNKTWEESKEWIQQRAGKPQKASLCRS